MKLKSEQKLLLLEVQELWAHVLECVRLQSRWNLPSESQLADSSEASDQTQTPPTGHRRLDIQPKTQLWDEGPWERGECLLWRQALMWTVWELQQVKDSSVCQRDSSPLTRLDMCLLQETVNTKLHLTKGHNVYFLPLIWLSASLMTHHAPRVTAHKNNKNAHIHKDLWNQGTNENIKQRNTSKTVNNRDNLRSQLYN